MHPFTSAFLGILQMARPGLFAANKFAKRFVWITLRASVQTCLVRLLRATARLSGFPAGILKIAAI